MTARPIEKVWVNPPKYWAATKDMTEDERQALMTRIEAFLSIGDEEQLRQFEFLSLEDPLLRWRKVS